MKVLIRSEKRKFVLVLPTALLLNPLTATIAARVLASRYPALAVSPEDLMQVIGCIKQYKKKNKRWEVVNIRSADGETVFVSL